MAVDMTPAVGLVKSLAQRRIAYKAVTAGARVVQKAAKAAAPKRKGSGALKQSLGVKAAKGKRGRSLAFAVIGPRKKIVKQIVPPRGKKPRRVVPAFYAHLVELGTRPHAIGTGRHPGTKPRPFLRPAYAANRNAIAAVMSRIMAVESFKALAKAKKPTIRKG